MDAIQFDVNKDVRQDVNIFLSPYDDTEPRIMSVAVSNEGIIMDFYDNAELLATLSMTYDEWFEFAKRKGAVKK